MLADQVAAVSLDDLRPYEEAERGEDPADDAGHGGLAGPGRPGEDKMPRRRLAGQPLPVPEPGHLQLRDDLVHLALDRFQADERVQLG
jgi:hypothetical protein